MYIFATEIIALVRVFIFSFSFFLVSSLSFFFFFLFFFLLLVSLLTCHQAVGRIVGLSDSIMGLIVVAWATSVVGITLSLYSPSPLLILLSSPLLSSPLLSSPYISSFPLLSFLVFSFFTTYFFDGSHTLYRITLYQNKGSLTWLSGLALVPLLMVSKNK